ncbi:uncharacterized protein LOC121733518 [Aricia agestis]|uniref:uncharacterized protein LOC121733518 n=1 Tax=Aricia agestis TaxID=91739 RepID=UPI001C209392|nr:uncharacterized protein LOC121733518 [Aricia agestis]
MYFYQKIFTNLCITILFLELNVADDSQEDEATSLPDAEGTTEEEWHMDFMPTGYLPDSVYRELAWYGILQIHPLHHSTKFKAAAELMWQHTLGRPQIIMENPPQSLQSENKISRQILAEEASKWSREQRAAQEVLMENIKSGGNGLTVRTVVGATTKTMYIVQNGNYFKCPKGTEPDMEAYRVQTTLHEMKCTMGKKAVQIPFDPCLEAESAPIEYSYGEGWMFCLGSGERDANYFQNGTLDCGNKTKVPLNDFLNECAIDNNVVITFEYFGDEPRKDLVHNTTLCSSWDPCHVSYLYRIEVPPPEMVPAAPETTQNPCDTTPCEECLEDFTEEHAEPINI